MIVSPVPTAPLPPSTGSLIDFVDKLGKPAWLLREDAGAAYLSPAFRTFTGRFEGDAEPLDWSKAIHDEARSAVRESVRLSLAAGVPFEVTTRVRDHTGTLQACSLSVVPLREPGLWLAALTPVEPGVQVLHEPRAPLCDPEGAAESLHALLLDQAFEPAFAWELGPGRRIVFWNEAAEKLYDISRSEALGHDPRELLGSRPLEALDDLDVALAADGRWMGELVQNMRDGQSLLVETVMKLVRFRDGRRVVLETGRDVTAQRGQERARVEAQTRLQLALSASRTGIWEWRVDTDELYWSPETFALVAVDPQAFTGTKEDFERLVHPDDAPRLWEGFTQALARGGAFEHQYRMQCDDGRVRWVHNRCVVECHPDGSPRRVIGTLRDLTDLHALHAELAANEASYRALANAMPQIVWTSHPNGGFEWINQRWREYTGATTDNDSVRWSFVHPDDVESIAQVWSSALATPAVCEFEYRLRRSDGDYRWHLARCVPFIERGKLVRWIATATDIDDRKRAEDARRLSEERARLRAEELATLMDAVPAVVLVAHDPECLELRGNRLASEMLRVPPGANLSESFDDARTTAHFRILSAGRELLPAELPVQRAAQAGVALRDVELDLEFADGACMRILGSAVPLRDAAGRSRGAIGAFVDVTRLKLAEEALRAADKRKDEFLAVLSHELRNPLAPITTAVELMKLRGGLATEHELAVVERQARHMVRLVDDLLDISGVARGKIELRRERMEIARVVSRAVEVTAVLFEQRQHELSVQVPQAGLEIDADETRLTQVLVNLLTNAARYTKAGGHVQVVAARDEDQVVVRVHDDGMGITPELLPHVFEMFVQGPRGPERAEGGLGLGLALVVSLTALHGGTVRASSNGPGLGSTFELRLPRLCASATAEQARPLSAPAEPARQRRTVLIVDDNEDAAQMLSMLLERVGFEVRIAHDPPAALSLVESWCPEIAILDIGLPVMDGHQLAREMRRKLGDRLPRLIALSGYGQAQDREHSQESGFAHHLTKPVARDTLLSALGGGGA